MLLLLFCATVWYLNPEKSYAKNNNDLLPELSKLTLSVVYLKPETACSGNNDFTAKVITTLITAQSELYLKLEQGVL